MSVENIGNEPQTPAAPDEGAMRKPKKKHRFLKALGIIVLIVIVACAAMSYCDSNHRENFGELSWPTSDLASRLPVPEWADVDDDSGTTTMPGDLITDSEIEFYAYVAASSDEYNAYVDACVEAGFTVDYDKSSSSYSALDEDGCDLDLSFTSKEDSYTYKGSYMRIVLYAPEDFSSSEAEDADESDDGDSSDGESTSSKKKSKKKSSSSSSDDSVDSDLKAWLDGYEDFMEEYVDFMKEYEDADDSDALDMLTDYYDLLDEYAQWVEELDEWDEDDMSEADLAYYLEVTARVTELLADI